MKISPTLLFQRSRDPRFLTRAGIAIGVVSVIAAGMVSLISRGLNSLESNGSGNPLRFGIGDPQEASTPISEWAAKIRLAAGFPYDWEDDRAAPDEEKPDPAPAFPPAPGLDTPVAESAASGSEEALATVKERFRQDPALTAPERGLLDQLADALAADGSLRENATAALGNAASADPPRRHAAEFLGDALSHSRDWNGAIDAYRDEVRRFPGESPWAWYRLADLLGREGRIAELGELFGLPGWVEEQASYDRTRQAARDRDYLGLLWLVIQRDLEFDQPAFIFLSLFAAAIWFLIITRFAGAWRRQLWLYLAAFILGFFSATLTLYVVWLQGELLLFNHDPEDPILDQLIYCVAGIGLREEVAKLLLFMPLVPLLAKRGHDIDALVCAGLVGLGFAFNENIGYLGRGGEFTTWGRFLTANFAHVALTGIAGLSLVKMWRRPGRHWEQFLQDFLLVVLVHGAYDALLMVPDFGEYSILSIVVFALLAYLFLDQATALMRREERMNISPLAIFVLGAALLIGVVLCFACWGQPFGEAVKVYGQEIAGMLPIAFIFINRLRDL